LYRTGNPGGAGASEADFCVLSVTAMLCAFAIIHRGEAGVTARTYLGVTIKVRDGLWLRATPRV
jgi:hypothetical protein